jgi:hypothetical protein
VRVVENTHQIDEQSPFDVVHKQRALHAEGVHEELINPLRRREKKEAHLTDRLLKERDVSEVLMLRRGQEDANLLKIAPILDRRLDHMGNGHHAARFEDDPSVGEFSDRSGEAPANLNHTAASLLGRQLNRNVGKIVLRPRVG